MTKRAGNSHKGRRSLTNRIRQRRRIVLDGIARDHRLVGFLKPLCETVLLADVLQGSRVLQPFFLGHARLSLRPLDTAFFVQELISLGLKRVNWCEVATMLLDMQLQPPGNGSIQASLPPHHDATVGGLLFQELLSSIQNELEQWGDDASFPERVQSLVLFFRDFCSHIPREANWSDGELAV